MTLSAKNVIMFITERIITMKKLIALILILLLPLAALADKAVSPYVQDDANIIDEAAQRYINTQNAILEKACGARIIIVTTMEMNRLTLAKYADFLAASYKINSGKHQNSVIVILNPKTHDYTAVVSDAISRALTGVFIEECLINYMEPDFAKKKYETAAVKTFNAIAGWYAENYKSVELNLTDDMSEYKALISTEKAENRRRKTNRTLTVTFSVIFVLAAVLYVRRRLRILRIQKKRRERRTRYLRLGR